MSAEWSALDLVKACVDGDPAAWERLRSLLHQLVQRYGAWRQSSVHDAEDLVQDVCEALAKDDYRLLRSYNPELASLHTFLTSIIVNKKKHWARAHSNHPSVTLPLGEILPDIEDYDSAWARRLDLIVLMDIARQVLFYWKGYTDALSLPLQSESARSGPSSEFVGP